MGKASRKINKKKQQENIQQQQAAGTQLREQMRAQEEQLEYASAIEILAEMVDQKLVTAADMYAGARDYFMLGDYTRSGQCVNTVLTMEPSHIDARILLGKLCLNEERIDDALAIYDFVLRNFLPQLTDAQKEEIQDALRYYGCHEPEKLRASYAACYAVLEQLDKVPESVNRLSQGAETSHRLQDKLCGEESVQEPASVTVNPREESAVQKADTALQEKAEVLERQCSLLEKINLLNRFAGAHFYQSDYAGAKELLAAALDIDSGSDMSLRNLAVLLAAMGDKEKALEAASQMQVVDFVLLQQLKG